MPFLIEYFPNVDDLLRLKPEELAWPILSLANEHKHNGLIHIQAITQQTQHLRNAPDSGYPPNRQREAELALSEAWNWLHVHLLLMPDPGANPSFMRLTRKGEEVVRDLESFEQFKKLNAFPINLLHKTIADAVWSDIARGDLDAAVFKSFKAVEVAVREAGGFSATDIGVDLMRKAFGIRGPLSDQSKPEAEREALTHLFAGAIGSYKNPHSHRNVTIDAIEAQEMVMLATHLLRIVDSRQPRRASTSA